MHTAICAFADRQQAEEAVAALVRAGFDRGDVHIEHRHASGEGGANTRWDGMEREVAVDRSALSAFGHFFASLFGQDPPAGQVDRYAQHVERGSHVVVVDGQDEAQAQRAQAVLQGLQGLDSDVVHRAGHRPLRDLVAMRGQDVPAGMVERSTQAYESGAGAASLQRERAMAANTFGTRTGPDLREPELEHAPGLRYADQDDKPI